MTTTTQLGLTELQEGGIAYPQVNLDIATIDALLFASVKSATASAPPGSPVTGDRYLIPFGATGAWSSHVGDIAIYIAGWKYYTPKLGWILLIEDESPTPRRFRFDGSSWIVICESQTEKYNLEVLLPTGSETRTIAYFPNDSTIRKVWAVIVGSTSVDWNLYFASDRDSGSPRVVFSSDRSTSATGTPDSWDSFDEFQMNGGNFLWLASSAVSGTPDALFIMIEVQEN